MTDVYERTISPEEARSGYFLVLKNMLPFFPEVGAPFSVKRGVREERMKVEAYRCICRGAHRPHEHYFVRWKGLAPGDRLIVRHPHERRQTYTISIEEHL